MVVWYIWKNRNLFVFQEIILGIEDLIKISYSWAKQYTLQHEVNVSESQLPSTVSNLFGNWIQLNTDGVFTKITIGGALRDRNGSWILGYNRYMETCSILDIEL